MAVRSHPHNPPHTPHNTESDHPEDPETKTEELPDFDAELKEEHQDQVKQENTADRTGQVPPDYVAPVVDAPMENVGDAPPSTSGEALLEGIGESPTSANDQDWSIIRGSGTHAETATITITQPTTPAQ